MMVRSAFPIKKGGRKFDAPPVRAIASPYDKTFVGNYNLLNSAGKILGFENLTLTVATNDCKHATRWKASWTSAKSKTN